MQAYMNYLSYDTFKFENITNFTMNASLNILIEQLLFTSQLSLFGKFYDKPEALEEIKAFFRRIIQDNKSIVAINLDTFEIVGVAFIKRRAPSKIDKNYYKKVVKNCNNAWLRRLVLSLIYTEYYVQPFKKLSVPCHLQIVAMATQVKYIHSNLQYLLARGVMELIRTQNQPKFSPDPVFPNDLITRNYKYDSDVISIIATNESTKEIFKKLNFIGIKTISYETVKLNTKNIPDEYKCDYKEVNFMVKNIKYMSKSRSPTNESTKEIYQKLNFTRIKIISYEAGKLNNENIPVEYENDYKEGNLLAKDTKYMSYLRSATNESTKEIYQKLDFTGIKTISYEAGKLNNENIPVKYENDYKERKLLAKRMSYLRSYLLKMLDDD